MNTSRKADDLQLKAGILSILDENRIMSIATLRPDGWPQATMVGFVHDDLAIYFAIGRGSQKFHNIEADSRVSIAIGHDNPDHLRGLSLAGRAVEVLEVEEIQRLNRLIQSRYPEQSVFAPREASSAVLRVAPCVISVIDMSKDPGAPVLVAVESHTSVRQIADGDPALS
jgi:general stress protein 26